MFSVAERSGRKSGILSDPFVIPFFLVSDLQSGKHSEMRLDTFPGSTDQIQANTNVQGSRILKSYFLSWIVFPTAPLLSSALDWGSLKGRVGPRTLHFSTMADQTSICVVGASGVRVPSSYVSNSI